MKNCNPALCLGLFDRACDANKVVQALVQAGISRARITILAKDRAAVSSYADGRTTKSGTFREHIAFGAFSSSFAGELLSVQGLSVYRRAEMESPADAAMETLARILSSWNISEEYAAFYAASVARGAMLVAVEASSPEQELLVSGVMARNNVVSIEERMAERRERAPFQRGFRMGGQVAPAFPGTRYTQ